MPSRVGGPGIQTLIIAEAGVNHNGDIALARRLVEVAAAAGAHYCKFQTFRAENLVSRAAPKAAYQQATSGDHEGQFEMLKRLELSREDHLELMQHCRACHIEFLSTPFDEESALLLHDLGLKTFKIPSGELTNFPLLRLAGSLGSEFILSTGMATLKEVELAISALCEGGAAREKVALLQCTTRYPTPPEDVNLRAIQTLREHFQLKVGLSDHSEGIDIALAAVALGAHAIEKHFTLDRGLPGPDHKASLEPSELERMVQSIARVEKALGTGLKGPVAGELANLQVVRKSLHTSRSLAAGHVLRPGDLVLKRPGNGMGAERLTELVGRRIARELSADHLLEEKDVTVE